MLSPAPNPISKEIVEFLEYNQGSARSTVVWDTLKAHLQDLIIIQITTVKTRTKEWRTLY